MARERRKDDGEWHLHKGFSIGLILAIILQSASFIWYGSKIDMTVQEDHASISEIKAWREKQDDDRAHIDSHLAVMDQKLTDQNEKLTDQGKTLQRIDDRLQSAVPTHK